jgi:membrane protein required for colicin V production
MGALTGLDMITLLLVGGGLVLGFMRGFVTEILSLLSWVAAILALKFLHEPVAGALEGPIGTSAGAAVAAFALIFGVVFIVGKLLARSLGTATKKTAVIGPIDRVLGGGFGALKGLIGATLLYLAANLVYDTIYGQAAERPEWIADSRTYPLLHASGRAVVDFIEAGRTQLPGSASTNLQNEQ